MEKVILLVLFLLFLLSGCAESSSDNFLVDDINNNEDEPIVEKDIEKLPDFSNWDDVSIDGIYTDKYFSFQDLLDDEYAKFYYGKVTRIEDNNIFVDSLYFDVIKSEYNEVLGEIRVSVEKDQNRLFVGNECILFLGYTEGYDYYWLSDPYKAILKFSISGDVVYYSDEFSDLNGDIGNSREKLMVKLFD